VTVCVELRAGQRYAALPEQIPPWNKSRHQTAWFSPALRRAVGLCQLVATRRTRLRRGQLTPLAFLASAQRTPQEFPQMVLLDRQVVQSRVQAGNKDRVRRVDCGGHILQVRPPACTMS